MSETSKRGISFECRSIAEANLIGNAVNRYARVVLKPLGIDLRNYAPATAEGAGFGWDAVQRAARDMGKGTITHMSPRMARAIHDALASKSVGTKDPADAAAALDIAARLRRLVKGGE